MKKLRLKISAFHKGEVLSRSQLKKIMGGDGSGSGSTHPCGEDDFEGSFTCCTTSSSSGSAADAGTCRAAVTECTSDPNSTGQIVGNGQSCAGAQ